MSVQGLAHFPGIVHLVDATISIGHGITPSVAQLTIAPQSNFTTEVGTLRLSFGGTLIEWPGCRVDRASFQRNASGEVWRLSIFDRRWRWRFGQITGTYNARRDDGTLRSGQGKSINTERNVQQLAALCLQAMGESDFDVSDLPNDTRPSVEWNAEVPAAMLASLCDQFQCRVVLRLDNRVAIRRVGVGAALPAGLVLENSVTVDVPERPDALAVICGPKRYQVDFPLEAVGLEAAAGDDDETLKPIDEVSYRPADGWSKIDLPFFHQVAQASRELACKSVFRYYRIRVPVEVPGYEGPDGNKVKTLEQLLPIEDEQVETTTVGGEVQNLPARVFGVWHRGRDEAANNVPALVPPDKDGSESAERLRVTRPFVIDTARGLVIFDEPVVRNDHPSAHGSSGYEVNIAPADLVLRAACQVRDADSLALDRYVRVRSTGSIGGTEPSYIKHEELTLNHVPQYSASYKIQSVRTNRAEIDAAADRYLDAWETQFQTRVPQIVRYPGVVPVELDGAIQQVTFHVGPSGATTTAARSNERLQTIYPHAQRRHLERQAFAARDRAARDPQSLARELKTRRDTRPRPTS